MSELLKKIVVVIPSGGRISYPTERMFGYFTHERIVRLSGCSDVGLARNLAANMALKRLQEFKDAPAVLWLDDDMFAPIEIVERHISSLLDYASKGRNIVLSGVYPQRQNTKKVAGALLVNVPPELNSRLVIPRDLLPMLPGMGCMAYERDYYIEYLHGCRQFTRDDGKHFAAFDSGLIRPDPDTYKWLGEDIHHALELWDRATPTRGGVFADPALLYGHMCELVLTCAPTSLVDVFDEDVAPVPLGSFRI
jgi:hypothetical protein